MDNNQIMTKQKLGFSGILRESLKLPIKYPNFILVFLITSFPLFFFLVLKEIILKQSWIQLVQMSYYLDGHTSSYRSLLSVTQLIENVSPIRLLSTLLLLGFIHLLDLLNTIIIVHTASVMYAGGEANPMNLNQMLCTSIKKVGFRGPLITSICALILSSLTTIGLSILAIIIWHLTTDRSPFLILIFGALYLALFPKHIEWSGIWNMGMVISILEEKHGSVAIGISWYLSKGSRKRGFLMAFVLYAWNLLQNYHVFIMRSGIEDELEVWWKG
ncbi:hypothetical protein JRO89_XS01G0242700 [Xanthoceras sorbifolium]|uniref:Uncharacterized protein n=1 Tax=Xanthoceras sorbifolium TaxID=99658 RepID=A0ABQ8IL07_9ROSI|nr:hypothetical protein JRO89_XS01G0242700 [Xanthoceras sorbifolium]